MSSSFLADMTNPPWCSSSSCSHPPRWLRRSYVHGGSTVPPPRFFPRIKIGKYSLLPLPPQISLARSTMDGGETMGRRRGAKRWHSTTWEKRERTTRCGRRTAMNGRKNRDGACYTIWIWSGITRNQLLVTGILLGISHKT
jgi:hypothetical protein